MNDLGVTHTQPHQITTQAIWETGQYKHDSGPFGRAIQTSHDCGGLCLPPYTYQPCKTAEQVEACGMGE